MMLTWINLYHKKEIECFYPIIVIKWFKPICKFFCVYEFVWIGTYQFVFSFNIIQLLYDTNSCIPLFLVIQKRISWILWIWQQEVLHVPFGGYRQLLKGWTMQQQEVSSELPLWCPCAQFWQELQPEEQQEDHALPGPAVLWHWYSWASCRRHIKVAVCLHNYSVATTLILNCNSAIGCLVVVSLIHERACSRQCGPHHSLVAVALLNEHESLKLRILCGRRVATLFVGRLYQRFCLHCRPVVMAVICERQCCRRSRQR